MTGFFDFLHRNWQIAVRPPAPPPKAPGALRFGILGAASIAPMALISPARSHPEVVVAAVAARDKTRAAAYARKHGIPRVLDSYAALLADPDIDAVYVPLPVSAHYEWAARALQAGKHVLLEKPSVANGDEAEALFGPKRESGAPVLLEARHYQFQPSWLVFLDQVERENVERVEVRMSAPGFPDDDIRFQYEMAGGALMDMGIYHMSVLRAVFGKEPEACVECKVVTCPPPRELCDSLFDATFRFPNGGTGKIYGNLNGSMIDVLTTDFPTIQVWHHQKRVADDTLPAGQEKWVKRKVTNSMFIIGAPWHRITVEDAFEVRRADSGKVVKQWTTKQVKKAYTFKEAGRPELPSEKYWLTFRYMLEEFVNRIRGREGSGAWISAEDSIAQMRMADMAYDKAGLPRRKSPAFQL